MFRRTYLFLAFALLLPSVVHAQACALSLSRYIVPAYSGSAVAKLRENGGNTTADFKLNASNALVRSSDSTPLATWLSNNSATTAFIDTWYDQTGNGNYASQATTTKQPSVVVSAVNGHAAAKFDGTDDWLDFANDFLSLNSCTVLCSFQPSSADADRRLLGTGSTTQLKLGQSSAAAGFYLVKVGATVWEVADRVSPWPRVISARHGSNTGQGKIDLISQGSATIATTGVVTTPSLGADAAGTANFFNNYLSEFKAYTSAVSDGTWTADTIDMMGVVGSRQLSATDFDTDATGGDSLHAVDINGNGLKDLCHILENGRAYWMKQTAPAVFTKYTIRGTSVSGSPKVEGCLFHDPVGDGTYRVFAFDQGNGEVRIYDPAAGPDYTGTWTEGVIVTGVANVQRGWLLNIGGSTKIVIAFEGSNGSTGGISVIEYDGSGAVTSSANWVTTPLIVHPGAWAIAEPNRDLDADGDLDIMFTARDGTAHNANAVPGVYWIACPASSPLTNVPWTEHTIQSASADYTNLIWGDWFGNGRFDLCIQTSSTTNGVRLYDSTSGWGSAITPTTFTEPNGGSFFNVVDLDYQINGRDALLTQTSSRMVIWQWDGAAWFIDTMLTGAIIAKADNTIAKFDIDADGDNDLVMADSVGLTLSYVDFSIPHDAAYTVPAITSNGAGSTATIGVTVGATAVTTATADGSSPLTFSLYGTNASLFSINSSSGVLTFSAPAVAGSYAITVNVTNLAGSDTQDLTINATAAANGGMLFLIGSLDRSRFQLDQRYASNVWSIAP